MNLVWITPECPYPANTGGRVGIWKRIEYLSKNHNIYLYTIIDDKNETSYIDEMKQYCKDVFMYERSKSIGTLIHSIIKPFPVVSRSNNDMKNDIEDACESIQPDFVMVDLPQMFNVLSKKVIKEQNIVLNQHNIEHLALKSIGEGTSNILKRLAYKFVSVQMRQYEKQIYSNNKVALYTFVSSDDKKYFEDIYGIKKTLLVPVGAELQFDSIQEDCYNMMFVAKMSYQSNEDGALWLLNRIWGEVKKQCPQAKLYLVGKDPSEKILSKAQEEQDVIVTGTVDSVDEYYKKCNVVVVPILAGGGVKVKLIEALGKGKYVVTTKKGLEGTDFIDGQHLFATEDYAEFIERCVEFLNHPNRYKQMQEVIIEKMTSDYSWQGIICQFEETLIQLIKHEETEQ